MNHLLAMVMLTIEDVNKKLLVDLLVKLGILKVLTHILVGLVTNGEQLVHTTFAETQMVRQLYGATQQTQT